MQLHHAGSALSVTRRWHAFRHTSFPYKHGLRIPVVLEGSLLQNAITGKQKKKTLHFSFIFLPISPSVSMKCGLFSDVRLCFAHWCNANSESIHCMCERIVWTSIESTFQNVHGGMMHPKKVFYKLGFEKFMCMKLHTNFIYASFALVVVEVVVILQTSCTHYA